MEAINTTTAIQIATANKFFSREQHKHAEMPCKLSIDGNVIFFYWASAKRIVGKTHSCQYHFYPEHFEITKHIYKEYWCFWERTTRHEYITTNITLK